MTRIEDAPEDVQQVVLLLDRGFSRAALQECRLLLTKLTESLQHFIGEPIEPVDFLGAVIKKVCFETLDRQIRAAREYLGWTTRTYEEVWAMAGTEPSEYKGRGPLLNDAPDDAKRAHLNQLLESVLVRRQLAGRELQAQGYGDRQMRNLRLKIAEALLAAMDDLCRNSQAIDEIAKQFRQASATQVSNVDESTVVQTATRTLDIQEASTQDPTHQGHPSADQYPIACSVAAKLVDVVSPVRPDDQHKEFDKLVEAGHRVIVVTGDRGNGKSRFALEVARAGGQLSVRLDATSRNALSGDLTEVLSSREIVLSDTYADSLRAGIAFLTSGPKRLPYVILDNADDPKSIGGAFPSAPQSIVIITTTERIPKYENSTIELLAMDPERSYELASGILEDEKDAILLTNVLAGRPLAIVQVCKMAKYGLLEAGEFAKSLRTPNRMILE